MDQRQNAILIELLQVVGKVCRIGKYRAACQGFVSSSQMGLMSRLKPVATFVFLLLASGFAANAQELGKPFVPGPAPHGIGGGDSLWGPAPQVPHLIVRSPQLQMQSHSDQRQNDPLHDHARATVSGAVVQPVWRQPYAYGYFGARPNGHWRRHYGYHSAYTQWTLK